MSVSFLLLEQSVDHRECEKKRADAKQFDG